ncbi:MAG: helix-turn-helix domain-containing protein [Desulfomonilaceae bacterium]
MRILEQPEEKELNGRSGRIQGEMVKGRLLTAKEVADCLQVSVKEVHQCVRSGRLDSVKISPKKLRFLPEQVDEFIRASTISFGRPVDNKPPKPLPCKQKGGKQKSVEDVGTDLLGKEIRSLCR